MDVAKPLQQTLNEVEHGHVNEEEGDDERSTLRQMMKPLKPVSNSPSPATAFIPHRQAGNAIDAYGESLKCHHFAYNDGRLDGGVAVALTHSLINEEDGFADLEDNPKEYDDHSEQWL